ncbi:DUF1016 N-terminal domain-containing protein [Paraflavisolibacter sp. H34]|uniref:DUF1016 N-terminal domain-containing protein n=1 Tax=Huijunlia imazamoxiresistens TaxID=3127457 RepID=UPI0039C9DF4D
MLILLALYRKVGRAIFEQQQAKRWGTKVIDRLAADLQKAYPKMKGISARNLKHMRTFGVAYMQFVQ